MTPLSTATLRRNLADILDRAEKGETFIIVANKGRSSKPGRVRAVVGPVPVPLIDPAVLAFAEKVGWDMGPKVETMTEQAIVAAHTAPSLTFANDRTPPTIEQVTSFGVGRKA